MGRKTAIKEHYFAFPAQAWRAMQVTVRNASSFCNAVKDVQTFGARDRRMGGSLQENEYQLALSMKKDTSALAFILSQPIPHRRERLLDDQSVEVSELAFEARSGIFRVAASVCNIFNRNAQKRGLLVVVGDNMPGEEVYQYRGPYLGRFFGPLRQSVTDVRVLMSQYEANELLGKLMQKPLAQSLASMPHHHRLGHKPKNGI